MLFGTRQFPHIQGVPKKRGIKKSGMICFIYQVSDGFIWFPTKRIYTPLKFSLLWLF